MTDTDRSTPRPVRVLLVEDDAALLGMARQILTGAGHEVTAAHSAEVALGACDEADFDVLFTDVVLPGISGIELADRLRAREPGLAILITTGQWDRDVRRAVTRSEHHVLRKPYTAQGLRDALATALGAAAPVAPEASP